MISLSDELVGMLYSNYIPRCDISISIKRAVYFNNAFTEYEVAKIDGSELTSLNISQKTDIFGRELPSISANWEQYATFGSFGDVDTTVKDSVTRKMAADISFVFTLRSQENSWSSVLDEFSSWQDLLDEKATWNDVIISEVKEEVPYRRLFLTNQPTLNGEKWKWEARDMLFFLERESDSFAGEIDPMITSHVLRTGIGQKILSAEKYVDNTQIFNKAINNSTAFTKGSYTSDWNNLEKAQLVSGQTKNILKDLYSCVNRFISFDESNGAITHKSIESAVSQEPIRFIGLENMKDFPTKEQSLSVANYVFDFYRPKIDRKDPDEIKAKGVKSAVFFPEYESTYRYVFNGVGTPYSSSFDIEFDPPQRFNMQRRIDEKSATFYIENAITTDSEGNVIIPEVTLTVYPITSEKATDTIVGDVAADGKNYDDFVEKNTQNVYERNDPFLVKRNSLLREYFNKNNSTLKFETYGDVGIETGDVVLVQLNEEDGDDYKVVKGIVVANDFSYNGATKNKITVHTLIGGE